MIFTRNPEAGKVKSRLAKDVGDQAALEIYKFLLQHTAFVTKDLPVDRQVFYSEKIEEDDLWDRAIFSKKLQQGEGLGTKMLQAFQQGFQRGYRNIIIIGSDLYDLSSKDIENAFRKLEEQDFVLGPAEDGGYYLLGMNKLKPEIFKNKTWGTPTVLNDTLHDLKGEKVALLEERNDVDYYEDIQDEPVFQQFLEHMPRGERRN